MSLILTLALFTLAAQPVKPTPHVSVPKLNDIATILAHDEGWPLGNPDYTLDPMIPVDDDGFDSIGVYRKGHLVRMYSIDRTTGDVVDFMRGCQVFRFEDIKRFQAEIRQKSHASPLTDQQLAIKAGCPKLTVVNSRLIH
jgi:hypothetical protein